MSMGEPTKVESTLFLDVAVETLLGLRRVERALTLTSR